MKSLEATCISTRHQTRRSFIKKLVRRYSIYTISGLFFVCLVFVANVYVLLILLDIVLLPLIAIVTIQQIKALHLYDCLRANKSTSAWGVEARVPFLDKEFIKIAMDIDPEWKMVLHS